MTDKNQRDQFNSASAANRYGRNHPRVLGNENTDPYCEEPLVEMEDRSMKGFMISQQSNLPPRMPVDGDMKTKSVISTSITERLFKTKGVYPKQM